MTSLRARFIVVLVVLLVPDQGSALTDEYDRLGCRPFGGSSSYTTPEPLRRVELLSNQATANLA